MNQKLIQIFGIALTLIYAAFVVWIYATEPKTLQEVATKVNVTAGTYQVDAQKFDAGLKLFREGNYRAARDEFMRADAEKRDARTQYYISYSLYREGCGRVYSDDALFKQALESVKLVFALDANYKTDDDNLQIKTPAELKAELEKGIERSVDDLNPLEIYRYQCK